MVTEAVALESAKVKALQGVTETVKVTKVEVSAKGSSIRGSGEV